MILQIVMNTMKVKKKATCRSLTSIRLDHPLEHLPCASVFPESAILLASVVPLLRIFFQFLNNFNILLLLNGLLLKSWLRNDLLRGARAPWAPLLDPPLVA